MTNCEKFKIQVRTTSVYMCRFKTWSFRGWNVFFQGSEVPELTQKISQFIQDNPDMYTKILMYEVSSHENSLQHQFIHKTH